MHGSGWQHTLKFFVPNGIILLLSIGFLRPHGLPAWLHQPVAAFPYVVLIFGLVFGWYLSHARMILSLLVIVLAERAAHLFPFTGSLPHSSNYIIFSICAFLLPLNLLAFSLLKDYSTASIHAAVRLILICLQPFLVIWLCYPEQQEFASVFHQAYLPWISAGWTAIPQPALLMSFVAGLFLFLQYTIKHDPFDAGSAWAIAAIFLAYHGRQFGWDSTSFFTTAGLVLFISLIQSSHHQTYRDDLTGIAGRLAYEEATAQVGKHFALAVLSIDQLHAYGSAHGKSVAEQILKLIAPRVQTTCQSGLVFRISGEELTLLFPGRTAMESLVELEQVRKSVEAASLSLRGRDRVREEHRRRKSPKAKERELPLTVSIGVAGRVDDTVTLSQVIKSAYRALYDAKAAGGNLVKRGVAQIEPLKRKPGGSGRIIASGEFS